MTDNESLAVMACYYAIFTDMSKALYTIYGFSNTDISLVTISVGAGSIVSSFVTGKLLDRNYRRHAERLNLVVARDRQLDICDFPVERARMEVGLPLMLLGFVGVIGYAWTLRPGVSVAAPIVFLFLVGYSVSATSSVATILMADIQ